MLSKLYKHEFHSLFRILWPVYAILFVLAIFNRIFLFFDTHNIPALNMLQNCIMFFYVISIIAIFVVGIVIVITRFYKHLLTSEGYLTFTLPVTVTQHLTCKLVCGMAVMILNVLGIIGSIFIMGIGTYSIVDFFKGVGWFFEAASKEIGVFSVVMYTVSLVLLLLLTLASTLLMFYVSIAIGQQFKSRIGGAVLTYIAIYMAMQIIAMVVILPIIFTMVTNTPEAMNNYNAMFTTNGQGFINLMLGLGIGCTLVTSTAYYLVTRYMLSKKLNLE